MVVVAIGSQGMKVADTLPLLIFGGICELDEAEAELDGAHRNEG